MISEQNSRGNREYNDDENKKEPEEDKKQNEDPEGASAGEGSGVAQNMYVTDEKNSSLIKSQKSISSHKCACTQNYFLQSAFAHNICIR